MCRICSQITDIPGKSKRASRAHFEETTGGRWAEVEGLSQQAKSLFSEKGGSGGLILAFSGLIC
jgi:hypothetical protein